MNGDKLKFYHRGTENMEKHGAGDLYPLRLCGDFIFLIYPRCSIYHRMLVNFTILQKLCLHRLLHHR